MPVPGRHPKPDGEKRNRMKPVHDWVEVVDRPFEGRPPMAADKAWPAATKRWWRGVTRMPHCVLWDEMDWQFAHDTAGMVAQFHGGNMRLAAEIRQRERMMGTTFDSRRDIRVRYVAAEDESSGLADVSAMDDYRKMIDG